MGMLVLIAFYLCGSPIMKDIQSISLWLLLALSGVAQAVDARACGNCAFEWDGSSGSGEGVINCPNAQDLQAQDSWTVTRSFTHVMCGPVSYDSTFHPKNCVEAHVVGTGQLTSTETFTASPSDWKWHYFHIRTEIVCTDGGNCHMTQDS